MPFGPANDIVAVDVVPEKVELINWGLSLIADAEIEAFLAGDRELPLAATLDGGGLRGCRVGGDRYHREL